ncbi:MAG: RluA family pseudouridine synthase, partial [Clostridiales bacterium]|nr:RluA family pseudouridine synthase [Clostridiales bacterium]
MVTLEIGKNEKQQRLDKFLRKYLDAAPLSGIYKMIRKDVKVNGKRRKEDYILQEGDQLTLYLHEDELTRLRKPRRVQHAKKQFRIAYEDDDLLIAVKPSGLLTHGNKQEHRNHLTNQVVDYLIQQGSYNPRVEKTFSPAPVNRLDRNTSGLVIFCKNYTALQDFNALIKERGRIHKRYLTLVSGLLRRPLSLTDRMEKDEARNRVSIADDGKIMHTEAKPLYSTDKYGGFSLAEVEIETGRTHQI